MNSAIATKLASEGAIVAINYRKDAQPAEALVSELNEQGFKAQAFRADMSKPEESKALLKDVVEAFGKLDILVSNSGIEHFSKLEEITKQDFDRVFSTNVAGLNSYQKLSNHSPTDILRRITVELTRRRVSLVLSK
jgi:3-oxoacyl-[acyl-carrier protein] reductase